MLSINSFGFCYLILFTAVSSFGIAGITNPAGARFMSVSRDGITAVSNFDIAGIAKPVGARYISVIRDDYRSSFFSKFSF